MIEVSEFFRNSFLGGGTFVSQECMCGRIHFCDPEISHGDYEEGEYEILKELQSKYPKKYIESEFECISYFDIGDNIVIWDCPCHNDVYYEKLIWNTRFSIMNYYKYKLQKMERQTWDLTSHINELDFGFDSNEKYTYEEFINKLRDNKLKTILTK
jgi:hypothetical protein